MGFKQLFEGYDLTDEFKQKTTETFNTAVNEKVAEYKAALQKAFTEQLLERSNQLHSEFIFENVAEIARLKKEREILENEVSNVADSDTRLGKTKKKVEPSTTDRDGKTIITPKETEKKKDEKKQELKEGFKFRF